MRSLSYLSWGLVFALMSACGEGSTATDATGDTRSVAFELTRVSDHTWSPTGLAFDGERLWILDRYEGLFAVDREGRLLERVPVPNVVPGGWADLAIVPGGIAVIGDTEGYRYDLETGELSSFFCILPEAVCGDASCDSSFGEACDNCEVDCGACTGPVCGDGSCGDSESCETCDADCGACVPTPVCGDASCDPSESCEACEADCGACEPAPACGDGSCDPAASESCATCASDCGECGDDDGECTAHVAGSLASNGVVLAAAPQSVACDDGAPVGTDLELFEAGSGAAIATIRTEIPFFVTGLAYTLDGVLLAVGGSEIVAVDQALGSTRSVDSDLAPLVVAAGIAVDPRDGSLWVLDAARGEITRGGYRVSP